MRAVVQRVTEAAVNVNGQITGKIGAGQLVLVGIAKEDTETDAAYLSHKVLSLRIFDDENGKMNRNVQDICGSILAVSQFTLYGDVSCGTRPSYDRAAPASAARHLYELFVGHLRESGVQVETGVFQAKMKVSSINDGPVTIICESVRIAAIS